MALDELPHCMGASEARDLPGQEAANLDDWSCGEADEQLGASIVSYIYSYFPADCETNSLAK
eukprot:16446157-Heterocapsa_arctica.AAC.1